MDGNFRVGSSGGEPGNRYKLVVHDNAEGEPTPELFDIRDDPAEQNDIFEAKPDVASELADYLRGWQASVLESLIEVDYR